MWYVCLHLRGRRFNRKIALESGGRLPPADNIMYATLSGSHLNMASRAIAHRCTDALSIDAIPSGWRDAIMEGVSWLVLKRTAWIEFPALADLLCQAGNSIQAISKAEDEIQLLRKILQSIRCFKGVPKWVEVSGEVLRSRPRCSASGAGIFGFALRFGGCSMIDATESHIRNSGRTNRELGLEVWTILSQEMKNFNAHLRWRHMLLKFGFCNEERPLSATDATGPLHQILQKVGQLACLWFKAQR